MGKKVILIILDSLGIGALPDAQDYGDQGTNTLAHILNELPQLRLPNMLELGLGRLDVNFHEQTPSLLKHCCYGRMMPQSKGKDTITGHWEMTGIVTSEAFPVFPKGFPTELINTLEQVTGAKFLGNEVASGTEIIQRLGPHHQSNGQPIIYTSADSVLQIAAHESIFPLEQLYQLCSTIRDYLQHPPYNVSRVIARPFIGERGHYTRTANRRDYALMPPQDNLLVDLKKQGRQVVGIGKIEDIFAEQGLTYAIHTKDNRDGLDQLLNYYPQMDNGLLFVNLVDFDSVYGHRRDVVGYGDALEAFDQRLPDIIAKMDNETLLIIAADHGCDPTAKGTDHTREYVPLLLYGSCLKHGYALGTRSSFGDLGATIGQYLRSCYSGFGTSFLKDILLSTREEC